MYNLMNMVLFNELVPPNLKREDVLEPILYLVFLNNQPLLFDILTRKSSGKMII